MVKLSPEINVEKVKNKLYYKLLNSKTGLNNLKKSNFQADFSLDTNRNTLVLNAGSLKYDQYKVYQFTVSTNYLNDTFSQTVTLQIDPSSIVPIAVLK